VNATSVIIEKLIALGANTRRPANQSQIMDVERQLGCSFPDGVKEFYRSCDGVDHATTKWIWDFFSLERVVERTVERRRDEHLLISSGANLSYSSLICFCDVLIDAPTYLFFGKAADERFGHFFADQGGTGWHVADSYEGFAEIFVAEHDEILLHAY
jgi:hypothetical protein